MGTLGPLPCCDSGGQAGLVAGGGWRGSWGSIGQLWPSVKAPPPPLEGQRVLSGGGNLLCESISAYLY